jgi:hydrogenase nickel incorporation protein HypA/HybF
MTTDELRITKGLRAAGSGSAAVLAMHEYSIVHAVLKQVDKLAAQHAGDVKEVFVSIGDFSGVDADLLEIAFARLAAESSAKHARLNVRRTELQARCRNCEQQFEIKEFQFVCPHCRETDVQIVRGEELMLESITLEED